MVTAVVASVAVVVAAVAAKARVPALNLSTLTFMPKVDSLGVGGRQASYNLV